MQLLYSSGLDVIVQWFRKVPTRMPEGIDFVFTPVEKPGHKWWMNKIEDLIDPLNVVENGSQRLHGNTFIANLSECTLFNNVKY